MPRLPRVTPDELVRALISAGLARDRQKGSHLTLVSNDAGRRVVVPMHGGTLKAGTTRAIIREAGLSVEAFVAHLG